MAVLPGTPQPGELLLGKYRIERLLGEGGMGVVVEAVHVRLGQRVAIKFLQAKSKAKKGQQEEAHARFLREAQAASKIQSEHAAKVTDVGEMEDGSPYMIMEFLQGQDLEHVLAEQGPLPISDACCYVLQACEALAEAHSMGIIHRDLKPANLFLTSRADGEPIVKVLDFGIAKANDGFQTKSVAGMGTLLYMPPEQLNKAKKADARSDVWALGATLFELLTGHTPFDSGSEDMMEIMRRIEAAAPAYYLRTLRPDAPEALERAISACFEKEPDRRLPSMAALAAALAPFAPRQGPVSVQRTQRLLERSGSLPIVDLEDQESTDKTRLWRGPSVVPAERSGSFPTVPMYPAGIGEPAPGLPGKTQPAWGQTQPASPTPSKPSRGLLVAGGVGLVALLGVGAFLGLSSGSSPNPTAGSRVAMAGASVSPSTSSSASSAVAPSVSAPAPVASGTSPPVVSLTALPTAPAQKTATPPPGGGSRKTDPPKPQKNCNPPYILGADGKKKYKPECL